MRLVRGFIAVVLSVLLGASFVPAASASTPYTVPFGCSLGQAGTQADPYLISSDVDFLNYLGCLALRNSFFSPSVVDSFAVQTTNIDIDPNRDWLSNFSVQVDQGKHTYDGRGYSISGYKAPAGSNHKGLIPGYFNYGSSLEFRNLVLRPANWTDSDTGTDASGALIGSFQADELIIDNVHVVADNFTLGGRERAGLVGYAAVGSKLVIQDSSVSFNQYTATTQGTVGMLIGFLTSSSSNLDVQVLETRVSASVSALGGSGDGLIFGNVFADSASILVRGSYLTGSISTSGRVGGIFGYADIDKASITVDSTAIESIDFSAGSSVFGSAGMFGTVVSSTTGTLGIVIDNSYVRGVLSSSGTVSGMVGSVFSYPASATLSISNSFADIGYSGVGGTLNNLYAITTDGSSSPPIGYTLSNTLFNSTTFAAVSANNKFDYSGATTAYLGATPRTTAQLADAATYAGFDFGATNQAFQLDKWESCSANSKPYLATEPNRCSAVDFGYSATNSFGIGETVLISNTGSDKSLDTVNGYSVSPTLPAGLDIHPITGDITGHPRVASANTTYTVTGTNGFSAVNKTFELEISADVASEVSFNLGGAKGSMPSVTAFGSYTLPAIAVSRDGFYFAGWGLSSGTSEANALPAGSTINVSSDTTLYAIWATGPLITYNANGGSGTVASQTVKAGVVTLPAAGGFTREGFYQVGWSTDRNEAAADATSPGGNRNSVTADSTFYAIWQQNPDCTSTNAVFDDFYLLCNLNVDGFDQVSFVGELGEKFVFNSENAARHGFIFITDLTPEGTIRLDSGPLDHKVYLTKDVFLRDSGVVFHYPTTSIVGDYVYFFAAKDGENLNLLRADADGNVTTELDFTTLIGSDAQDHYPYEMIALGNKLFLGYYDDKTFDEGLFVYDLTLKSFQKLLVGTGGKFVSSFATLGERVFALSQDYDTGSEEIISSNGTISGSSVVTAFANDKSPTYLLNFDQSIVYQLGDNNGAPTELWITDGNSAGTKLVSHIGDAKPVVFGDKLIFTGYDSTHGYEPWVTDGTTAGTSMIADITPGSGDSYPHLYAVAGDYVYFDAQDGTGVEDSLYRWDGVNPPELVAPEVADQGRIIFMQAVGDQLLFEASTANHTGAIFVTGDKPAVVAPPQNNQNNQETVSGGTSSPVGISAGIPLVTSTGVVVTTETSFELTGENLRGVLVSIGNQAVFSRINAAGNLEVIIPTGLTPGSYDVVITHSSGEIAISNYLTIESTEAIASVGEPKGWTKRIPEPEIKLYFKNPVGAGKVQFFHNGNEIAWVRAESEADPKLRTANGSSYLVRTRDLVSGKNVFEIYLDGERVRRTVYSLG